MNLFENISNRFKGQENSFYDKDIKSEDVEALLSPGKVEALVRVGRIPVKLGAIKEIDLNSNQESPCNSYYQIPPKGFSPDKIRTVVEAMGCYMFIFKDGRKVMGPTFTLNDEESAELERRIMETKELINQENSIIN